MRHRGPRLQVHVSRRERGRTAGYCRRARTFRAWNRPPIGGAESEDPLGHKGRLRRPTAQSPFRPPDRSMAAHGTTRSWRLDDAMAALGRGADLALRMPDGRVVPLAVVP